MDEYQKGYAAGRRKRARDNAETALWQRVYVAAIPTAMVLKDWKRGENPINGLADRVRLAREVADESVKQARLAGRV